MGLPTVAGVGREGDGGMLTYRQRQNLEREARQAELRYELGRALNPKHVHEPIWDQEIGRYRCNFCGLELLARDLSAV